MQPSLHSKPGQSLESGEAVSASSAHATSEFAAKLATFASDVQKGSGSCLSLPVIEREATPSGAFLGTVRIGERPDQRYQVELLLRAAGEQLHYGQLLEQLQSDPEPTKVIDVSIGSMAFQIVLDRESDLSAASVFVTHAKAGSLEQFSNAIREIDQAQSIADHFARRIVDMGKGDSLSQPGTESERFISIGDFTLTGADRFAALASFVQQTTARFCSTVSTTSFENLESVVDHLPNRQIRSNGESVEVASYTHVLKVTQNAIGGCSVEMLLDRTGILRDADKWFASSDVAREIGAAFDTLGVLAVAPRLGKLLSEVDVDTGFGNGFASLSRRLMNALFKHGQDALPELRALTTGVSFREKLSALYDDAAHPATKQILALVEALSCREDRSRSVAPTLPCFKSFPIDEGVRSCADAEGYFVMAVQRGNFTQDAFFLYKGDGQATALSKCEIAVDGYVFPAGTLCSVRRDSDGAIMGVRPLRLTMFSLPYEEAIEVFRPHYDRMQHQVGDNDVHLRESYATLAAPFHEEARGSVSRIAEWIMKYIPWNINRREVQ